MLNLSWVGDCICYCVCKKLFSLSAFVALYHVGLCRRPENVFFVEIAGSSFIIARGLLFAFQVLHFLCLASKTPLDNDVQAFQQLETFVDGQ